MTKEEQVQFVRDTLEKEMSDIIGAIMEDRITESWGGGQLREYILYYTAHQISWGRFTGSTRKQFKKDIRNGNL